MGFRILLPALCFIFLLSCTRGGDLSLIFQKGPVSSLPNGLVLHEYVLKKNDLRILLVPNGVAPVFSYSIRVNVGSKDEAMDPKSGRTGLAHFFEHMMFRGTKKYGDFFKLTAKNGSVGVNANTSKDATNYIASLPKEKLDFILSIESDRFQNLPIHEKLFKTELGAVQSERESGENSPNRVIWKKLAALMYSGRNPYRQTIIGTKGDLDAFTVEDARRFFRTYYVPNNMILAIVGDIKVQDTLRLIEKHFSSMERKDLPKTKGFFEKKQKKEYKKTITHHALSSPRLAVAYRTVPESHKDAPALAVLTSLLAWGKSSLLEQSIVEKGLANTVSSGSYLYEYLGVLELFVDFLPSTKEKRIRRIIARSFQKIKDGNIEPSQFRAAKNLLLLKNYYPAMSDNRRLANVLLDGMQLTNDPLGFFKEMEEVKKITLGDVQALLPKYIRPENTSILFAKPKNKEKRKR